jgi:hypothetical protein
MDNVEEVLYGFRDKHDEVFQGMLTVSFKPSSSIDFFFI